jgi:Uma2 family endonuclease
MADAAQRNMDVDAFLAWSEGRDGRWELRDGRPTLMAPERAIHALTKFAAQRGLDDAVREAGVACRMFPDGMTVRINSRTAFEPDALIVCPSPAPDAVELSDPVVVLEVLSPSTAAVDHGLKLDGYFSLPSVQHYLILDPDRRVVIWHGRGREEAIETRVLHGGRINLDPHGIEADVAALFPEI